MKNNETQNEAVSAIASATKSPFKTAFKITFGIAVAHLVIGLLFLGGCATVVVLSAYLAK